MEGMSRPENQPKRKEDEMKSEHHIVINTKYHGPSNVKGSRVTASYDGKRIIKSWDYSLESSENHEAAALEFIARHFPEYSIRAYGATDSGYVFLVR